MWIIVLLTLAVAFASGITVGLVVERGYWEGAFAKRIERLSGALGSAMLAGPAPTRRVGLVAAGRKPAPVALDMAAAAGRRAANDNPCFGCTAA